jgi:integrase
MAPNNEVAGQIHDAAGRRKYLSEAEFGRFLAAADRLAFRRRALLYVLAYTGCRLSEALALTPHQLDADGRTIRLRTLKRRRTVHRALPLPDHLVAMLVQLARSGEGPFWPLHRSAAWRWSKLAMRNAGIHGPMASPKGLRHSFGVRAVSRNIPLPLIQRWMGHARATTTAIYLEVVDDEERQLAARMW